MEHKLVQEFPVYGIVKKTTLIHFGGALARFFVMSIRGYQAFSKVPVIALSCTILHSITPHDRSFTLKSSLAAKIIKFLRVLSHPRKKLLVLEYKFLDLAEFKNASYDSLELMVIILLSLNPVFAIIR